MCCAEGTAQAKGKGPETRMAWSKAQVPPHPKQALGALLTRSRPRSSSLSCRCDRDKVPSCWFQSSEPRFRKWALSSVGSQDSAATPPLNPKTLAMTRLLPPPKPPCSHLQSGDRHAHPTPPPPPHPTLLSHRAADGRCLNATASKPCLYLQFSHLQNRGASTHGAMSESVGLSRAEAKV